MIRVAIDAMGGDYAPREIVHGAVLAAREYGVSVRLSVSPKISK
jgi:glycerol-3-phosphate acyltransferase PlsX